MKIFKFMNSEMSVSGAILLGSVLAGVLIGGSVFFTTLFFFGGVNNRTKLFPDTPVNRAPVQTLTPDQIRQLQEAQQQRLQAAQNVSPVRIATTTTAAPTPTTKTPSTVKPR